MEKRFVVTVKELQQADRYVGLTEVTVSAEGFDGFVKFYLNEGIPQIGDYLEVTVRSVND